MSDLPNPTLIYHFTDVENQEGILGAGVVRAHWTSRCTVDIADDAIKDRRMRIDVPCGSGGKVCDYVPFYFAPRSPMLFRIRSEGVEGVEGVSSDQRRIVYLVSSTEAVLDAGASCVFTDGNAAAAFTGFYEDPELLSEVVDWPLMRAHYWANTSEDPDRRRRRCAEFLVHEELPLELIAEMGVYDEDVRSHVAQLVRGVGCRSRLVSAATGISRVI